MAPLLDDIFEEILLRVPPDDPARLVHSALVCKPWFRLVSGPRFRRRYRELHGAAPMLGFLAGFFSLKHEFVSTSSFRTRLRFRNVVDSRHGRVLLHDNHHTFMVWDPRLSGQRIIALPEPEGFNMSWNAAVLCATGDCNHLDCHQGPFLVVYVARIASALFISVYSSRDGSWSDPIITFDLHGSYASHVWVFLEYCCKLVPYAPFALMTGEDGRLGLATVENSRLCIWSREDVPHGHADGWVKSRDIELKEPLFSLRSTDASFLHVVGAADGVGVVFLVTIDGIFTVDLKSGRAKNIHGQNGITDIWPYMSFYPPVRGLASSATEEPSTSASGV